MADTKRLAFFADSHFSSRSRFAECIRLHDWMADDMRERGVEFIGNGGDTYDKLSSPDERNAVAALYSRLGQIAPSITVRGNHDGSRDLQILERIDTKHPIVVEEMAQVHYVAGCAVAAVAWPRKAELLAAFGSESMEEGEQAAREALRAMFRQLGAELAEFDGPRVLLMHAMVRGSMTSTGQPLVGCDLEIGLEDLALVGADLYVLGHIHKGQSWDIGGAPVIYPGSPRRTAFGETEAKGYAYVEFDGRRPSWQFIDGPATQMLHFEMPFGHEFPAPAALDGAEARVRFHSPRDKREEAQSAARAFERALMEAGASSVKLEEVVSVESRARAPEVSAAVTLPEKLRAFWASKGFVPGSREESLISKAVELEHETGLDAQAAGATFQLRSARIHNMGPYSDFAFDLRDHEGQQLIAVTGPNGAGKSTLLELATGGAMYRSTATRGSLVDLATARDSMMEVELVTDQPWTIRHLVDTVNGKGESVVLDEDGAPALDSAKVKAFDQWATLHMPARELLETSIAMAQQSEGFLAMKPGDRKAVLLRGLGLERLETLALAARAHQRDQANQFSVAVARLEEVPDDSFEEAFAALTNAQQVGAAVFEELEAAKESLARLTEAAQEIELSNRQYDAQNQARAEKESAILKVKSDLEDTRSRIANNEKLLASAADVRAAVAETEQLRATLEVAHEATMGAQTELARVDTELSEARRNQRHAEGRIAALTLELAGRDAVWEAVEALPNLRLAKAAAETALTAASARLEELVGQRILGAEQRVVSLRDGLVDVQGAGTLMTAVASASAALSSDDEVVLQGVQLPRAVEDAKDAVALARLAESRASKAVSDAELLSSKFDQMNTTDEELARVKAEIRLLEEASHAASVTYSVAAEALEKSREHERATAARIDALKKKAAYSEHLLVAETRLEGYRARATEAELELIRLETELSVLPAPATTKTLPDLEPARLLVRQAEQKQRNADSAVGLAEGRVEAAKERTARRAELQREVDGIAQELSDWNRLAQDLGRDGIQATEIDSAGPELTARVNDLLHACVGTRWTVSIETTKLSADGKRTLEGCEVRVIDTEQGRDAEARTFSGGERVILGEAVSLALADLACSKAGMTGVTLVRDESGAALDPAMASAYVAMLRMGASRIGAKHILLVSHSPEVVAMADGHIDVTATRGRRPVSCQAEAAAE